MLERILYASFVDVSIPYGPGVNERTFLADMAGRFGDAFLAVIPTPSRGLPRELNGLRTSFIPCQPSVRTTIGWTRAHVLAPALVRREVARFRPDLAVMRLSALPTLQFTIARTSNIPYAIKTAGDVSFAGFYKRSAIRRSLRFLSASLTRHVLEGAACIDVVSDAQRQRALRLFPQLEGRIHVIDNGVDLYHFSPECRDTGRSRLGLADGEILLGYVGNFPMRRGGREVIDVVAELAGRTRVRGLIIGDGGEMDACRAYAAELGVSDRVDIPGEVAYEELPAFVAAMDVGLSILRPEERGESEQKVRQYLASGVCVVGTSGSNDFLRGKTYARVVDTMEVGVVGSAVASLIIDDAGDLVAKRSAARRYAEDRLSPTSRNSERLALWAEALAVLTSPACDTPGTTR